MADVRQDLKKVLIKKMGLDDEKVEKVFDYLDLLEEDPEQVEETKVEEEPKKEEKEVEPTKAEPQEEQPKVEEPKETKQELDYDSILEKLGIDKIKSIIENQSKEIDNLKKVVEKTKTVGAQPKTQENEPDSEYSFDNIFAKLKEVPQYKK